MRDTDFSNLSRPSGRQRNIRTKEIRQKIKHLLEWRKPVSLNKTAHPLGISRTSVQRILEKDLGLPAYKIQTESLFTHEHKDNRMRSANWIRTNFGKENTRKTLFSDEKMFDIDAVYNSQNGGIWAVNRLAADTKRSIGQKRKFLQKIMV